VSKASKLKAKSEIQKILRQNKYAADIEQMYKDTIDAAARSADGVTLQPGIFNLNKYPGLNGRVNQLLKDLAGKIDVYLHTKVATEWAHADIDNDNLFDAVLNRQGKKSALLNYRNNDALAAFVNRKDGTGLNLSKRIYNYVGDFKQELETGLGDGIVNGRSAAVMARDLKQYLNEPDKLFRRVKVEGKLKLSKAALNYKPGQGVYRSSHKNMMRLTRSETNMAYRMSDHVRYQNSPFIIGFEVKLSDRHPAYDMCDRLAGKYPKTFVFIGWHPQCICYEVPYMLTPDQYDKMERDFLAGKDVKGSDYTDELAPTGDQAKIWFAESQDRINNWTRKPYFLRDNAAFFKN
jgi:hypothetical protein